MKLIPLFIIIPLATAFFIPLVSRKVKFAADLLANLATLSLLILSFMMLGKSGVYTIGAWPIPIGINWTVDGLTVLMLITVNVVSFACTLYSVNYMELYTSKLRYYSLFLLMVGGMNGVIMTGDLFNLYVFLEIASIASYALVGFGCEHEELEASFKYLVLGSVASIFILLGVGLCYSVTGTLNMADFATKMPESGSIILFIMVVFLMGFGLKAAIAPFHAWLPDAHPSAPAPISAMLSGVLIKAIGIYSLIRIIFNIIGFSPLFKEVLLVLGALSMIMAVLLALGQWDMKRLLAYHSISQIGYVVVGLGLGTPLGILGGLFHLVNHSMFKSLLFLNAGAVEYNTGTRDLNQMQGLNRVMPVTGNTSLVASMSIAGIPPFNGFWSKIIIIAACIQAGRFGYAAWAVLGSLLTLASFLKIQKYAFFGQLRDRWKNLKEVPVFMCVSMIGLALICLFLGLALLPGLREMFLLPAANAVLGGTKYAANVFASVQ